MPYETDSKSYDEFCKEQLNFMRVVRVLIYEGTEEWLKTQAVTSGVPWKGRSPIHWSKQLGTIKSNVDDVGSSILDLVTIDPDENEIAPLIEQLDAIKEEAAGASIKPAVITSENDEGES